MENEPAPTELSAIQMQMNQTTNEVGFAVVVNDLLS